MESAKTPDDHNTENCAVHPDFIDWCVKSGICIGECIRAAFVSAGWRGIVATAEIQKDECILRVPRRCLMSCETARADGLLAARIANWRGPQPWSSEQLLAAHLLHEVSKGRRSQWYQYLRSLPRSFTTGMSLSPQETAALQVDYAIAQTTAARDAAKASWKQMRPILVSLQLPSRFTSLHAWIWALSTLSSRTMYLRTSVNDTHDSGGGCLTPFGDLFNYEPPPPPLTPSLLGQVEKVDPAVETAASGDGSFDEATDSYCIFARRQYQAGDEVFLCYGRHTNLDLLEHYGFVLPDNPHDTAMLFPTSDDFPQLAAECGIAPLLHANGNPSWEFLRALRLASLTPAERKSLAYLALNDEPVDERSEAWVMRTLKAACEATLARLPTTVAEDEAALAAGGLREGMEVALRWRLGYKRTLQRTIQNCEHDDT
jgi:hypothetical protein